MAYCSPDSRLTYFDTPSFYSTALHCVSAISIPTHIFGAYCILFQTPPRMASVKWSLLNLHFWTTLVDISLTILTIPYIVMPMLAGFPLGLSKLTGISTQHQTYFVVTAIAVMLVSIMGIFENRYHVLNDGSNRWSRVRVPWNVANYLFAVTFFMPTYQLFMEDLAMAKDFTMRKLPCLSEYIENNGLVVAAGSAPIIFLSLLAVLLGFLIIQIVVFCLLIRLRLKQYGSKLSERTLVMQKKLMRALILQFLIPLLIVITPLAYCSSAVLRGYHNQALNNISFIIISSHGFLSATAMISMHSPYFQVVLSMFRRLEQHLKPEPNSVVARPVFYGNAVI